ncbi:MAG: chromate transporter [Chitinophagaceae bacterium]
MLTKADLKKVREIVFLKDVFFIAISAFGGPEMHISLFLRKLVQEKRYINENDLLELNSLCQILPGPSSTQTLTAIAYKLGGPRLAFLALMIWIMPATILMTVFAISTSYVDQSVFRFIGPMAIGFIVMAAINMSKLLKKKTMNIALALVAASASVVFHSPFAFPVFLIIGAFVTARFGPKDFIPNTKPLINIRWANLSLMVLILITVAVLGVFTKNTFPHVSQPVRLFENTYRMGSMVFGGGNVLYSMVLTEFVEYRPKQYLTLTEFNTGLGLLQAVPGPTFTIATYANGIAMKKLGYDVYGQLIGCGVGTLAIFLPGTLLIFFVYPIWNQVKTYPVVYRSLDGIISVSIGFLWSAAFFMIKPYFKHSADFENSTDFNQNTWIPLLVFALTLLYLQYRKLPAFILVIVTILAGYLL